MKVTIVIALTVAISGLIISWAYPIDIWLISFLPHLALVLSVGLLLFMIRKNRLAWSVSLVMILALIFSAYNTGSPAPKAAADSEFTVLQLNIWMQNNHIEHTTDKLLSLDPDLIALEEITSSQLNHIQPRLASRYPFQFVMAAEAGDGIGLWSKFPLSHTSFRWCGRMPYLETQVAPKNGKPFRFLVIHTESPTDPGDADIRNHQLAELAELISNSTMPVMVAGDFNAVPWDPYMRKFRNKTGLKSACSSFSSTFPAWAGRFGIPIDYIWLSSNLHPVHSEVHRNLRSDHSALMISCKL